MSRLTKVQESYPKLHELGVVKQLAERDPSGNNKYLGWMAKRANEANEDASQTLSVQQIVDAVAGFHKKQQRLQKKDLKQYKTINELAEAIKKAGKTKSEKKAEVVDGAHLLHKDERSLVYLVKTPEAAKALGRGTKWCITNKNTFTQYTRDRGFVFVIDRSESKKISNWSKFALTFRDGRQMSTYRDTPSSLKDAIRAFGYGRRGRGGGAGFRHWQRTVVSVLKRYEAWKYPDATKKTDVTLDSTVWNAADRQSADYAHMVKLIIGEANYKALPKKIMDIRTKEPARAPKKNRDLDRIMPLLRETALKRTSPDRIVEIADKLKGWSTIEFLLYHPKMTKEGARKIVDIAISVHKRYRNSNTPVARQKKLWFKNFFEGYTYTKWVNDTETLIKLFDAACKSSDDLLQWTDYVLKKRAKLTKKTIQAIYDFGIVKFGIAKNYGSYTHSIFVRTFYETNIKLGEEQIHKLIEYGERTIFGSKKCPKSILDQYMHEDWLLGHCQNALREFMVYMAANPNHTKSSLDELKRLAKSFYREYVCVTGTYYEGRPALERYQYRSIVDACNRNKKKLAAKKKKTKKAAA